MIQCKRTTCKRKISNEKNYKTIFSYYLGLGIQIKAVDVNRYSHVEAVSKVASIGISEFACSCYSFSTITKCYSRISFN